MPSSARVAFPLLVLLAVVSVASADPDGFGACCLGPGSCAVVASEEFCNSLPGLWIPGIDCSGAPCATAAACCLGDGVCDYELSATDCNARGGEWMGSGSSCDDVSCAGGCCVAPFACEFLAGRDFCEAAGGAWLGADSDCAGASCLVGACCLPDGSCVMAGGTNGCNAMGGEFQGNGVDCAASTCDGACCAADGACTLTDVADCGAMGGDWQGIGSACSACDGACCFGDLTCDEVSGALLCGITGGVWQGAATRCADVTCPGGACCIGAGCLAVNSQLQCFAAGGEAFFPGLLCSEVTCGGACCLFDGSCTVTGQLDCLGQGGSFSEGETCIEACGGGCCLGDAGCQNRTPAQCQALGGCFAGVGSYCADITCRGFTETFTDVTPVAIAGDAGETVERTIEVPTTSTNVVDVDVALEIEHTRVGDLCVELSHGGVTVALVERQGTTSGCEGNAPLGCTGADWDVVLDDAGGGGSIDLICLNGLASPPAYVPESPLAAFRGVSAGGPWTLRVTDWADGDGGQIVEWSIDVTTCSPIFQACCFADGSCAELTFSDCSAAYGTPQVMGSDCAGASCPVTGGACCLGDDGCLPATDVQCDTLGGCAGGIGTTCASYECRAFVSVRSSDGPVAIPDDSRVGAVDTITVTGSAHVTDVDLEVAIDHTYVGDLCVQLAHDGQVVTVIERPGSTLLECGFGGVVACSQDDYDVVLDDAGGGGAIEDLCSPSMTSPPSYTPNEALAAFRGVDADGDWTIQVTDWAGLDVGDLVSWSLILTTCTQPCAGDVNGDGTVDFADLLDVLSTWGPCGGCPTDIDGDGVVGFAEVLTVLSAWGACP